MEHDWRLRHPSGIYEREDVRAEILATAAVPGVAPAAGRPKDGRPARFTTLRLSELTGDNFARMALRVAEVETSLRIIGLIAPELRAPTPGEPGLASPTDALAAADPFQLGFGCVEGARGGVGVCALRGSGSRPQRCKNAGPSEALLRSFSIACGARRIDGVLRGDILPDAPLANVSINGSPVECAG